MKTSNYNFAFPYSEGSNQTIFYNSRTNALALIENEKYEAYQAFCESGTPITDDDLVRNLTYGGFLVDSEVEELDLIRFPPAKPVQGEPSGADNCPYLRLQLPMHLLL